MKFVTDGEISEEALELITDLLDRYQESTTNGAPVSLIGDKIFNLPVGVKNQVIAYLLALSLGLIQTLEAHGIQPEDA